MLSKILQTKTTTITTTTKLYKVNQIKEKREEYQNLTSNRRLPRRVGDEQYSNEQLGKVRDGMGWGAGIGIAYQGMRGEHYITE